ncbi:MAG: hypothetical protein GX605_08955 [Chloroflexi bacterium]|nr:hypothetical protein [Chloroflexota bacterium]
MTTLPRRVLVVGWDGATWELLRPWVDEGRLPHLARLLAEGASGPLTTTLPPVSASAWSSFATGANPGKHGLVDFVAPEPGGYRVGITNAQARSLPTLWELLSSVGRPVIAAGVPGTYPPMAVNGVVVSSFLAPGPESSYTYPRELKQELRAHFGDFPLSPSEAHRNGDIERFVQDMLDCAHGRMQTFRYLLQNKPWDLATVVFMSPDTLQHELWHLLDPTHPRHDPRLAPGARQGALRLFAQLDAYLGELLDLAGNDSVTVLLSDHGFGPFHSFLHLNNWLLQQGWLRLRRGPGTALKHLAFRLGLTPLNVLRVVSALGLGRLRAQVKGGKKGGLLRRLFLSFDDVDWARTRAFAVGNFGQVYVNTAGVRAQGCVQPGAEYEAVREGIAAAALRLRDPANGAPVVLEVHRREEIFSGDQLPRLPDLLVHTDRRRYVSFGHADFGSNRLLEAGFGQSGHHTMEGILAMRGPGICPGQTLQAAHILDLAPTLLYLLGQTPPPYMDGRLLAEALEGVPAAADPSAHPALAATEGVAASAYSVDDEAEVRRRLEDLGYLG